MLVADNVLRNVFNVESVITDIAITAKVIIRVAVLVIVDTPIAVVANVLK